MTDTQACMDVAPDDTTASVVGDSTQPIVYAVSGKRGLLLVSDLATGRCETAIDLGVAGDRLGQPREAAGRVFVPDFSSGRVLVVDIAAHSAIARPAVLPPSTAFELRDEGSLIFYNDPATATAGVISLDGTIREIEKYDASKLGAGGLVTANGRLPDDGSHGTGSDGSGQRKGQNSQEPAGQSTSAPPQQPETGPPSLPSRAPDRSGSASAPPTTVPATGDGPTVRIAISAPQARIGVALTMQAVLVAPDGSTVSGKIASVSWSFGDGASGAGTQVAHAWASAGTFEVAATVHLTDGTSSTPLTSVTVIAQSPPTAALSVTPRTGTAPLTVTADASGSRAGAAPIASYRFDFGDGGGTTASSASNANHRYSADGDYTVTVTVTDSAGNSSATSTSVTVRTGSTPTPTPTQTTQAASAPLRAAVSVPGGTCSDPGADVTVDASGSAGGSGARTYAFDFGDGTSVGPAPSAKATHLYQSSGPFTVTVTVRDTSGATATATSPVTLLHLAASATSVPTGQSVTLTGSGICAGSTLDLNGAGSAMAHNDHVSNPVTFTYSIATTYHYSVHWSESNPYTDSNVVTVTVTDPSPSPLRISASQTSISLGQSLTLTATGGTHGGTVRYEWDETAPGPGANRPSNLIDTPSSVTFTPNMAGTWTFSVRMYDGGGAYIDSVNTVTVTVT
jgi:PKD repeat protein